MVCPDQELWWWIREGRCALKQSLKHILNDERKGTSNVIFIVPSRSDLFCSYCCATFVQVGVRDSHLRTAWDPATSFRTTNLRLQGYIKGSLTPSGHTGSVSCPRWMCPELLTWRLWDVWAPHQQLRAKGEGPALARPVNGRLCLPAPFSRSSKQEMGTKPICLICDVLEGEPLLLTQNYWTNAASWIVSSVKQRVQVEKGETTLSSQTRAPLQFSQTISLRYKKTGAVLRTCWGEKAPVSFLSCGLFTPDAQARTQDAAEWREEKWILHQAHLYLRQTGLENPFNSTDSSTYLNWACNFTFHPSNLLRPQILI